MAIQFTFNRADHEASVIQSGVVYAVRLGLLLRSCLGLLEIGNGIDGDGWDGCNQRVSRPERPQDTLLTIGLCALWR